MLCFTLVNNQTLDDMSFGKVKDFFVVPFQENGKSMLQDILFTDWPADADLALALNIPDTDVLEFSYYLYKQPNMLNTITGHYTGHMCINASCAKRIAQTSYSGKDLKSILESNDLRYFLAQVESNHSFLTCRVQLSERLDSFVRNRLSTLRDRIFVANTSTADDVNTLLDTIETFCLLNGADKECLSWCKDNAPSALRFCKDTEIIENMCTAWLYHIRGQC